MQKVYYLLLWISCFFSYTLKWERYEELRQFFSGICSRNKLRDVWLHLTSFFMSVVLFVVTSGSVVFFEYCTKDASDLEKSLFFFIR
jgi:hypothetical protein